MRQRIFLGWVIVLLMATAILVGSAVPVAAILQPTRSSPTRSVPNPITKFEVNGESETGDFLKASHSGGKMRVRGEDIDIIPWKSIYWDKYQGWVILFVNVTYNNFKIVFLYLFNGSRDFYYRRFDYATGTLEKTMFWGKQTIYNETTLTPSSTIPELSIPTNLRTLSPYSVLSKTTYIAGDHGMVKEGSRQLDLIPIFQQGTDPKELWTLSTDNQGEYHFAIYYFFESDRSHFTKGHNIRLNDLFQTPIETMQCYRTEGSFPSTIVISMPSPGIIVDVDGFQFKTDERGAAEIGLSNGEHTIAVPELFQQHKNTRVRFSKWTHLDLGNPGKLMLSQSLRLTAEYKVQHYFEVHSEYGAATGSGWYDEGTTVKAAVTPTIEYGNETRHVFTGWSGDIVSDEKNVTVFMDRPREIKANWKKQYHLSIVPKGLPDGASILLTINGAQFTETIPFVQSIWMNADSSVDLVVTPSNVTFASKSYLFDKWSYRDGNAVDSPLKADRPISLVAQYRPAIRSSISLIAQSSLFGDSVSLSGKVTPVPSKATLEISYSKDRSSWHKISEASLSNDGTFISNWKPTARGTIFIRASWEGNEEYGRSESPIVVLTLPTEASWENLVTLPGILQQISAIETTHPSIALLLFPAKLTIRFSMALCVTMSVHPLIRDVTTYLLSSAAIGVIYLTLPISMVVSIVKRIARKAPSFSQMKPLVWQLAVGLIVVMVSQLVGIALLTVIGLGIAALASLIISPTVLAVTMTRCFSSREND